MYVNDLTLGYGERGRQGVERLMTEAFEKGLIPQAVPSSSRLSSQACISSIVANTNPSRSTTRPARTDSGVENIGPAVTQV